MIQILWKMTETKAKEEVGDSKRVHIYSLQWKHLLAVSTYQIQVNEKLHCGKFKSMPSIPVKNIWVWFRAHETFPPCCWGEYKNAALLGEVGCKSELIVLVFHSSEHQPAPAWDRSEQSPQINAQLSAFCEDSSWPSAGRWLQLVLGKYCQRIRWREEQLVWKAWLWEMETETCQTLLGVHSLGWKNDIEEETQITCVLSCPRCCW